MLTTPVLEAAMTASAVKAVRKVGLPCCLVCHPVVLGVFVCCPLGAPSDFMEGSVGACAGMIAAISLVVAVSAPSDFARGSCSGLICTTVGVGSGAGIGLMGERCGDGLVGAFTT